MRAPRQSDKLGRGAVALLAVSRALIDGLREAVENTLLTLNPLWGFDPLNRVAAACAGTRLAAVPFSATWMRESLHSDREKSGWMLMRDVMARCFPKSRTQREEGSKQDPAKSPLDLRRSLDGLKILVVDDEADSCALLTELLTRHGAKVKASESAAGARIIFEGWKPDVLISDIGMPGESGYSLIRSIRAVEAERGGSVAAIALTGYGQITHRLQALAAGYDLHISKPVEPSELVMLVLNITGRHPNAPPGNEPGEPKQEGT